MPKRSILPKRLVLPGLNYLRDSSLVETVRRSSAALSLVACIIPGFAADVVETDLDLQPMAHPLAATVSVTLHPEQLVRNGRDQLPMGMLGVHNVPLDEARFADWGVTGVRRIHQVPGGATRIPAAGAADALRARYEAETDKKEKRKLKRQLQWQLPHTLEWAMDCFYDRYQPALQISRPQDWEQHLRKIVQTYVRNARATGQQHYLEFWNEPYLNWAVNPAVNYSPSYYVTDGVQKGDPMVLRGTGEAMPGLEWGNERFWVIERGQINYVISGYIPAWARPGKKVRLRYGAGTAVLEDGGTVTIRGKEWPVVYGRWGKDPKQQFYWSGPVSARLYNEMLQVVGDELQQLDAAGEIPLAGGWGFNIWNENWESWRQLIKPTIDAAHPYLDAIHEHHYGGDVRMVGSSYEVAYSYAQATYDRRLEFWNTEAGGHLDPQQPGNTQPHNQGNALTKARAAMTYLLRDVSYQWAHVPDKGIFRAAHHSHYNGGDAWAFRLLKKMGGALLRIEDDSQQLWAVATQGSDATQILLFNDAHEAVNVQLRLPIAEGVAQVAHIGSVDNKLRLLEDDQVITADGLRVSMGPVSAQRIIIPTIAVENTTAWTQFASADVLQSFKEPASTTITLPDVALQTATAAQLRLVTSRSFDQISVQIGDNTLQLNDVPMGVSDHALPANLVQRLQANTALTLTASPADGRLFAVSLWLDENN